jgi:hypothetical protein
MNLEDRALAYAQLALDEVTADPRAFGITRPWSSVDEWVAWELEDMVGKPQFTDEDRDAIVAAMRQIADLDTLNAPFKSEPKEEGL